jgi:hypothetical protein
VWGVEEPKVYWLGMRCCMSIKKRRGRSDPFYPANVSREPPKTMQSAQRRASAMRCWNCGVKSDTGDMHRYPEPPYVGNANAVFCSLKCRDAYAARRAPV